MHETWERKKTKGRHVTYRDEDYRALRVVAKIIYRGQQKRFGERVGLGNLSLIAGAAEKLTGDICTFMDNSNLLSLIEAIEAINGESPVDLRIASNKGDKVKAKYPVEVDTLQRYIDDEMYVFKRANYVDRKSFDVGRDVV